MKTIVMAHAIGFVEGFFVREALAAVGLAIVIILGLIVL